MLSDSIKDIRRKNYLNQTAFANRIGVTQSAVSQWENGLTRPNSEQLSAISQAFGISIDDLLVSDDREEQERKKLFRVQNGVQPENETAGMPEK